MTSDLVARDARALWHPYTQHGIDPGPLPVASARGARLPLTDGRRILGLPLALVARSGLGTLNHTLLTIEAIRARGLELRALFLVGAPHDENVRTLEGRLPGLPIVRLASLDPLDARGLDSWLDAHPLPELVP